MRQTPIHDIHNPDLLALIPSSVNNVIEIGCSSGALAREYKKNVKIVNWIGVEIDPEYARAAERYCDNVIVKDLNDCDESFYKSLSNMDCWIFGDVLEHLYDPWKVLKSIRDVIPPHGCVCACLPNAQHWSIIARLTTGDFWYEEMGLLDKTHIRWFTRKTIIDLFHNQGFRIEEGMPRIFAEENRDHFVPLIVEIGKLAGSTAETIASDVTAFQYVVRAVPI